MRDRAGINNDRRGTQARRKNRGVPVLVFMIAGFLAVMIFGCRKDKPEQPLPEPDMTPRQVVGIGRIEPEMRFLEISSEVSGIVTRINFRPGEVVDKGGVILELSNRIESARLNLAAARLETQRSQITAAQAALKAIQIRTENAQKSFERSRTLYNQDAEAKARFDAAKAEYESLTEDVRQLEAQLLSARNQLKQYRADYALAQAEYDRRFIKAPADGLLLTLDLTLGTLVTPQAPFGSFAPESPLTARCEIDELFAGLVETGQKAYIRLQGETESLARGVVTFAGPALRKKSLFSDEVGDLEDRRVREIWITLDPGASLLFGSRVECVILLGS